MYRFRFRRKDRAKGLECDREIGYISMTFTKAMVSQDIISYGA